MSLSSRVASGHSTTGSFCLVEDALEHLWDFAYLGKHPLAAFHGGPDAPDGPAALRVERGKALSVRLQDAIRRLGQHDESSRLDREQRYYDILHGCYVGGETNKAVALKIGMADRTFYRRRRQAIEAIAQILDDLVQEAHPD